MTCWQAGIPAAAAPQYAIKQWATCTIFPAATHTEFCDWALRVQHVPAPYNQLDVSLASTLLSSFTGNISKNTPTCVRLAHLVSQLIHLSQLCNTWEHISVLFCWSWTLLQGLKSHEHHEGISGSIIQECSRSTLIPHQRQQAGV